MDVYSVSADLSDYESFSESESEAAPAICGTNSKANGGISPTEADHSTMFERLVIDNDKHSSWQNISVIGTSPQHGDSNNFLEIVDSSSNHGNGMSKAEPSRNSAINCIYCDETATVHCKECNELICNNCYDKIHNGPPYEAHQPILLPKALGSSPPGYMPIKGYTPKTTADRSHICDTHNEVFLYVCESCNKLVCQGCIEHREHIYSSIEHFAATAQERINAALDSSRMGSKYIKNSIDRALEFLTLSDINCTELSENICKVYPPIITAIRQRERYLLNKVEKLRQRKVTILNDQIIGLKSQLSGISETSDMLIELSDQMEHMHVVDLAMQISNLQRNLEQIATGYKDLQPKKEFYTFCPPDLGFVQDLANQGTVMSVDERNFATPAMVNGSPYPIWCDSSDSIESIQPVQHRRMQPSKFENDFNSIDTSPLTLPPPTLPRRFAYKNAKSTIWEDSSSYNGSTRIDYVPAVPGSTEHVTVCRNIKPSLSFGMEGHKDGQLKRPWGLCVDKAGNILVSDRRNNRVQIFNANGLLKFTFGRKGNGDGEFDLPTGICVDKDNRIIVVDKDNHRVQIFTSNGRFLTKFGGQGRAHGQFQYPWDVAVNSRRQIVVTDSGNHRVQQFDSEGCFIRQIIFQNYGMNRGVASPRGVCYTPTGNIIVTDFENHCLYLVDLDNNNILASKGHKGSGVLCEFDRPSGVCCDDSGRIIVADSKNQRVSVYSWRMEFYWNIEIRPSLNAFMPENIDEKDRTCDVAVTPDGRIVLLIEPTPDSKDDTNSPKLFVHVY